MLKGTKLLTMPSNSLEEVVPGPPPGQVALFSASCKEAFVLPEGTCRVMPAVPHADLKVLI